MKRLDTRLDGPILIGLEVYGDERGFFVETYRRNVFGELGIPEEMVQDNHSRSSRGIVRGHALPDRRRRRQAGALRARRDLRRRRRPAVGSPTFGEWEGFELTEENMHMLYCPVGFAHGFCVAQRHRRRDVQAEQLLRG